MRIVSIIMIWYDGFQSELAPDIDPEVGQQLQAAIDNGQQIPVIVVELNYQEVKIHDNHTLMGKDLILEMKS